MAYYLKLLMATEPKSTVAPRLVKYLLNNRKHATYWNSTRDTALVVEAFADYLRATGEDDPDVTVEVWIDGQQRRRVSITRENLFTFDNKLVLTGAELAAGRHTVEIRKQGRSPIYYNGYLTNFTLEDDITAAGLELKVARSYYKLTPVDKTAEVAGGHGQVVTQQVEKYERTELTNFAELASGDLVEVELVVDSKNDYEYILLEDMKAAGFEPVAVRSGYNGNELGAYIELRDDRVSSVCRSLGPRQAQRQLPPPRRNPGPLQRPAHPRLGHVRPRAEGQLRRAEATDRGLALSGSIGNLFATEDTESTEKNRISFLRVL